MENLYFCGQYPLINNLGKNDKANTDALDPLQVLVQEYSLLSDIQEAEIYSKKRGLAYAANFDAEASMYPLETCRKEVKSYKEIFEIGETLKAQPIALFMTLSMTSLLMHIVAHSTKPSFRRKINNQPLKKFLCLVVR